MLTNKPYLLLFLFEGRNVILLFGIKCTPLISHQYKNVTIVYEDSINKLFEALSPHLIIGGSGVDRFYAVYPQGHRSCQERS